MVLLHSDTLIYKLLFYKSSGNGAYSIFSACLLLQSSLKDSIASTRAFIGTNRKCALEVHDFKSLSEMKACRARWCLGNQFVFMSLLLVLIY